MSDWQPLHSQLHERVDWFGHVPTSGCASLVGFEHMVQSRVCVCPCPMLWTPWGDPQLRQFLIYTPNRGYAEVLNIFRHAAAKWRRCSGVFPLYNTLNGEKGANGGQK